MRPNQQGYDEGQRYRRRKRGNGGNLARVGVILAVAAGLVLITVVIVNTNNFGSITCPFSFLKFLPQD